MGGVLDENQSQCSHRLRTRHILIRGLGLYRISQLRLSFMSAPIHSSNHSLRLFHGRSVLSGHDTIQARSGFFFRFQLFLLLHFFDHDPNVIGLLISLLRVFIFIMREWRIRIHLRVRLALILSHVARLSVFTCHHSAVPIMDDVMTREDVNPVRGQSRLRQRLPNHRGLLIVLRQNSRIDSTLLRKVFPWLMAIQIRFLVRLRVQFFSANVHAKARHCIRIVHGDPIRARDAIPVRILTRYR